jgi:hypothetical protein
VKGKGKAKAVAKAIVKGKAKAKAVAKAIVKGKAKAKAKAVVKAKAKAAVAAIALAGDADVSPVHDKANDVEAAAALTPLNPFRPEFAGSASSLCTQIIVTAGDLRFAVNVNAASTIDNVKTWARQQIGDRQGSDAEMLFTIHGFELKTASEAALLGFMCRRVAPRGDDDEVLFVPTSSAGEHGDGYQVFCKGSDKVADVAMLMESRCGFMQANQKWTMSSKPSIANSAFAALGFLSSLEGASGSS